MSEAPPDSGLHRERTALAWTRTCLGLAAVSLLMFRLGDNVVDYSVAAVGLACSAALMLFSRRTWTEPSRRHLATQGVVPLALLTALTTVFACVSGVLVLTRLR